MLAARLVSWRRSAFASASGQRTGEVFVFNLAVGHASTVRPDPSTDSLDRIHPFRVTSGPLRDGYGRLRRNGAAMTNVERERVEGFGRLEDGLRQAGDWYLWGPYLSERQWGTVREDYSADGNAWILTLEIAVTAVRAGVSAAGWRP